MLPWVLAFMAYDTAKTLNKKSEEKQRRQKIKDLQFKLSRPMTRGHTKQCICRLCSNRRNNTINEINQLISCCGGK